ncbi:DUF5610 domain-containing protein [Pseudomonas turukhanskensis]|uniref:DUF5610 domain-containing protein n=1 Tax=Pseudomonas turukhanskensis TaxID=1806536 RepID=A0A9W6NHA2_9PSED|nr:DUF5610 domain-containing protein [Pseudomonas turukhanskensis]GLK90670.1 hypothetical protein GCM10017655_37340 [Pseudomonas turukhanskensis]
MATSSAAFVPSNLRTGNVGNASTSSSGAVDPQKTLANRLADKLGLKPGELNGKASDFTPDKVSDRIVGFVGGVLKSKAADGADPAELQDMLDKMRKGVEDGFAEAKKILDGLGVLKGSVAADIEETFNKITAGLDKLAEAFGLPAAGSDTSTGEPTSITGDYSDRNYQAQAQSFNLDLTTLDGDKIHIEAANASSSDSTSSADGSSSSTKTMQVAGYSVQVDGDLSDEEMASLKDLFSKVSDISDKFYSGDLQGAFDQAVKLDINGTQLATMSLNMTTASVRATETYGSVAGGSKAGASNSALQDYAKSLVDGLQTASGLSDDPAKIMSNLLKGAFSLDDRFDQQDLDKAQTLNDRLLSGLKGLVTPQEQTTATASDV